MRLIRMNRRSRYRGNPCLHCHKPVRDDQVFFGSTYYVSIDLHGVTSPTLRTFSKWAAYARESRPFIREPLPELEIKTVYHRACIEKILSRGPLDREVERSMFDQYRNQLAEQFEEAEPYARLRTL